MSTIFISHSSKDTEIANEVKARLEKQKHHSIFLDFDKETGIGAGQNWERTLYRKLRACRVVVAICTDNYFSSQWCFAEMIIARIERKPIFALMANPLGGTVSLPSMLNEDQNVDLRTNIEEGFERLWKGFKQIGIHEEVASTWNPKDPPYPGLLAFQEKDANIFFGREAEIQKAFSLLNSGTGQNLTLVLGVSGSGKSSFVKAGLLPILRLHPNRWLVIGPFRPGQEPIEELAAALSLRLGRHWKEIFEELVTTGDIGKSLRDYRRSTEFRDAAVLLIIDQFEELLGHTDGHLANRFLELLHAGLEAEDDPISVLATMRSDFLGLFQQHVELRKIEFDTFSLGPISVEAIRKVIEEPARLGQLELEPGLTDRLLHDIGTTNAMPLLAFTLRSLWDKGKSKGILTTNEYEVLGGIAGAIARVAESAFKSAIKKNNGDETDLRSLFLKMVRVTEDGAYASSPLLQKELSKRNSSILSPFKKRRLLTVLEDGSLEVVHEILFSAWHRLASWLQEESARLILKQQLHRATSLWSESGYSNDDLWRGGRLHQAKELFDKGQLTVDDNERRFIMESFRIEDEAQRHRLKLEEYRSIRDSALRTFIKPTLLELINEIKVEWKKLNDSERARGISGFGFAEERETEINVIQNFLGQRGRWHPKQPYHASGSEIEERFKRGFHGEWWIFPCCGTWKLTAYDDPPSQFLSDGCEMTPEE